MGRLMGIFEWVGREQQRINSKMRLSLVSSVLVASMVQAAPGASSYGGPAKQIASPPSIQCRTEYVTLWDTEYQEREEQVCKTVYEKQCSTRTQRLCQPTTRQECTTEYANECSTIYKNVCVQKYRTEYEPYTESECTTEYKQDCQFEWRGYGNDKVWAPIEGTCQNVPYDECKQVAYQECKDVPEQKCVSVPRQVCVTVPDQVCTSEPLTECQDVPRQQCHSEHKRFPIRVSRQEPKKVCDTPAAGHTVVAAPIHAAPVHAAPAQEVVVPAAPSVHDLLHYATPAVPDQVVIAAKDKLQTTVDSDRIVFG